MKRSGFALLSVLWVLVAVGAITMAGIGNGRLALRATANRRALAQAAWAREACVEIVKSRYARLQADGVRFENDRLAERLLQGLTLDSIALDPGVWCAARATDAGSVAHVGRADRAILMCLLRDSVLVERVMEARQLSSGAALARAQEQASPGSSADWRPLGDIGTGQVNVNTASIQVLRCLPGLSDRAARQVVEARRRLEGFESLAAMVAAVTPEAAFEIGRHYSELSRVAITRPPQVILTVFGAAGTVRPLRATLRLVALTGSPELVITAREVE
ncbi:MAG: type II secretion system protein GspK [Gemmatimonadales bacterium]